MNSDMLSGLFLEKEAVHGDVEHHGSRASDYDGSFFLQPFVPDIGVFGGEESSVPEPTRSE